jgi:hypothetical protein
LGLFVREVLCSPRLRTVPSPRYESRALN